MWITIARPFDDDPNSPMVTLDLDLGENDPSAAVGRGYDFYDLSSRPEVRRFSGLLADEESDILNLFRASDQVVFYGIQDILEHEVERIGSMSGSPVNYRDAFENSSESKAVIAALGQRNALEFFKSTISRVLYGLAGFYLPGGH